MSPATLLDLWLNGVVFHDDHVKRERWAEVAAPFTEVPQMIIHRTTVRLLEICMAAMARLDYLQGGPGIVSIVEGRKVS